MFHFKHVPPSLCATLLLIGCLVECGCRSKQTYTFDQIDFLPAEEELSEFSLGEYKIPIPILENRGEEKEERRNRLQLDFELYALISPQEQSQVQDAWKRHEGVIRDRVIRICRNATVEELLEPELSTLKSRLTDVLASQLGRKRLRQLVITEVESQELL